MLFTLEQMLRRLPKDSGVSPKKFEELVETHGTYHAFGKSMLMTEQNFTDLLRLTAQRMSRPGKPSPNAPGLMCFIGHAFDPEALVFVGWCPLGQEGELLDRIKEGAQEAVMILCTTNATPVEVEKFKAGQKKAWRHGGWFGRTDALIGTMRAFNGVGDGAEEEDGEGHGDTAGEVAEVPAEA